MNSELAEYEYMYVVHMYIENRHAFYYYFLEF